MMLALVTGTSSGIGAAVARELLLRKYRVVGVSRRVSVIADQNYTHVQVNLKDIDTLGPTLDSRLAPLISDTAITRLALVNNAATEAILGPVSQLDATALLDVYAVNTAAPVLLMGWFQRHARAGQPLRIVNVSTGAATIALPGLAAYGNTKAALRMAGMVFAAELDAGAAQPDQPDTSILSFEPGVVDTPMQVHARETSIAILPIVQMFKDFAASGVLLDPKVPARTIADYVSTDGHPRWEERRQ